GGGGAGVSLAWVAYRMLAPCAGAIAPGARVLASPSERRLWGERLGSARLEGGCHAWIHAASLGEAVAVPPLVRELSSVQPGARRSERSVARYRRLGGELRRLVAGLAGVLCQGASDERRWLEIGARPERTAVVGNLKDDGLPPSPPDRAAARQALGLDRERPL